MLDKLLKQLEHWYYLRPVPHHSSTLFTRFLASATDLIHYITGWKEWSIQLTHTDFPFYTFGDIFIPEWTLNTRDLKARVKCEQNEASSVVVGAFTGAIVRAAYEVLAQPGYSVAQLRKYNSWADQYITQNVDETKTLEKIIAAVNQVYISKKVERTNLAFFNSLFLQALFTNEFYENIDKEPLNLLLTWCAPFTEKPAGELWENVTELFKYITADCTPSARIVTACLLHELLTQQSQQQQEQAGQSGEGQESQEEQQSQQQQGQGQAGEGQQEALSDTSQAEQEQTQPDKQQQLDQDHAAQNQNTNEPQKEYDSGQTENQYSYALKNLSPPESKKQDIKQAFWQISAENKAAKMQYEIEEVKIEPRKRAEITADPAYKSFGEYLSLIRTEQLVFMSPDDRGRKPKGRLLWRATTDERIFQQKVQQSLPDEIEVIILIDASGSIGSGLKQLAKAALGCFKSLVQARIWCGIYAHTTLADRDARTEKCLVYEVIKPGVLHSRGRFAQLIVDAELNHNLDGVAIGHVSKKFTKRNNTKVLLVISDGQPNGCYSYKRQDAIEHTQKAIETLRKDGVLVFALSIVTSVIAKNNNIYGVGYNIDATKDFSKSLQNTIEHVAKGGR